MDSDVVIRVEGLGKRYTLGAAQKGGQYTALRDVFAEKAKSLLRRSSSCLANGNAQPPETDFWALKDVSFEVRRGEVVGIIGRNGAGKSTLLKILSRITEPTEGKIKLRGRVASLLEVGTGFHPELTGRENIFLNGAILGMHRTEIKAKFDEIVAFAEVEKFLDTPVKRYSSGMYVRLAFAVAAHLEPEILIVDEVLAVGDSQFQKKCLGKMQDVAKGGRTVLFVSHQMTAIQSLCTHGVLMQKGAVQVIGSAHKVVQAYLSENATAENFVREYNTAEDTNPRITAVDLRWKQESIAEESHATVLLAITVTSYKHRRVALDLRLQDSLGTAVGFGSLGTLDAAQMLEVRRGENKFVITLSTDALANGSYQISLDLTSPFIEFFDRVESCIGFDLERPYVVAGRRPVAQSWGYGSNKLSLQLVEPNMDT